MTQAQLAALIAAEIACRAEQVSAAIALIDGGATVPFIARYRKEATGGLDDTQLRKLEERLSYLRELETRRTAILTSIEEQGKLDPALAAKIGKAATKAELEDLYLPFRPKRKTKADTARENGLEPLARSLLADRRLDPRDRAEAEGRRRARGDRRGHRVRPRGPARHRARAGPEHRRQRRAQVVPQAACVSGTATAPAKDP